MAQPAQRKASAPTEQYTFASAGKRAAEHKDTGSSNQCLRLPDGYSHFQVKAGTFMLDFFPYKVKHGNAHAEVGTWAYERTYWQHGSIGGGQFGQKHCCLVQNWNQRCPVCMHLRTLGAKNKSERSPQEEEMLKKQSAKERQIFCVALADDPKRTKMIMEHSFHLFGKKFDSMIRNAMRVKPGAREGMYDTFYNPADGYTVRVTFEDKKIGQGTCVEAASIEMIKRAKPYPMSILNNVPCFDDMLVQQSYDELYKLYWINEVPVAAAGGEDVGVADYQPEEYPVDNAPMDEAPAEDYPAEDAPVDEEPAEQHDNPEELPPEDTQYEDAPLEEVVEELPPEELPPEDLPADEVVTEQPEEDVTCGFQVGHRVVYDVKDVSYAGQITAVDGTSGVATIKEDGATRPRYLDCFKLLLEPEKPKPAPRPAQPPKAPAKPVQPATRPVARPAAPTAKPAPATKPPQGRQPLPATRPTPPKRG